MTARHGATSLKIPWGVDSDRRRSGRVRLLTHLTLEAIMQIVAARPQAPTAIRTDLAAIFVSVELSRSTWLITSLSPGIGEKMSKHSVAAAMSPACWSALYNSRRYDRQLRGGTGSKVPLAVGD